MKLVLNTAEMDAVFAELENRLTDMTPVMGDIGDLMIVSTRQNFAEGSDPDGNPWAPKSQATLDAYASRGETVSVRPLIGPSHALSSTIFSQPGPGSVSWGSNLIYARVMQEGASKGQFGTTSRNAPIPWGNLPARPFIGVGAEDETNIAAMVGFWLDDVDGAGLT